jgi:peptidoglycan/xylan/chitin deacetylase (PgdA/CDA1 family)
MKYGFRACVFVVTDCLGGTNAWDEAFGYESHPLLSPEQVRFWADRGIDFGAHGRTHRDLTELERAEWEREVFGSRDELAAVLSYEPQAFAYPYGRFSAPVVETVRRGFAAAFSARRGLNTTRTDSHLLRRILIHPRDSLLDLAFKLRLGASPTEIARRLRRSF